MAGIYLCNLKGTWQVTAIEPDVPEGTEYSVFMMNRPVMQCMIYSKNPIPTWPGVSLLAEGSTGAELAADMKGRGPNNPQRNQVNSWLTAGGMQTLPANVTTWYDIIMFITWQKNPGGSFEDTYVG